MTKRSYKRMRSRVHMLTVAAARLEVDHANPALIKAVREMAGEFAKARAEGRNHDDEEQRRIDRQRTLWQSVVPTGPLRALKNAMLQRAYDLLWDGDPLACDALLEFLPSEDVDALLSDWERDQLGKSPRSRWYTHEAIAI